METTTTPIVKTEIIDPSIESAAPEDCTMSILFKKDGLVFSILREDVRKFIVLGEYALPQNAESMAPLFSFKDRLPGHFHKTEIGFMTEKLAVIPAPLFDATQIEKYAAFQFKKEANETLQFDELSAHGLVLIYAVPEEIRKAAQANFQGVNIRHAAFYTFSHYFDLYKNKPGQHVHINFWQKNLEIVAIENGKILLCNTFEYETAEDVLYFVLNVFEQLELNPEKVPLKVSGEIDKTNEIYSLLLKYVLSIDWEERPAGVAYSRLFDDANKHKFNRIFQVFK